MSQLTVRTMSVSDVSGVCMLLFGSDTRTLYSAAGEWLQQLGRDENVRVLVAEDGRGSVRGCVILRHNPFLRPGRSCVGIETLLLPKGGNLFEVEQELLSAARTWAEELNCDGLINLADASRAVVSVDCKRGFPHTVAATATRLA